ncbi:MAG: hypothetical protein WAU91_01545 [Desulfatitalea sp.]
MVASRGGGQPRVGIVRWVIVTMARWQVCFIHWPVAVSVVESY